MNYTYGGKPGRSPLTAETGFGGYTYGEKPENSSMAVKTFLENKRDVAGVTGMEQGLLLNASQRLGGGIDPYVNFQSTYRKMNPFADEDEIINAYNNRGF